MSTGKLSTDSRIQFSTQNKLWSILFLQDRIDFNYNYQENTEEFRNFEKLYSYLEGLIEKVFHEFNDTTGDRMSITCKVLMNVMEEDKFNDFINRFTIPLKVYNEKNLQRWGTRYSWYEFINIDDEKGEECNCTVDMSSIENVANSEQKRILVSLNIDTISKYREFRFTYDKLLYFANDTKRIIKQIMQEIQGE